VHSGECVKGGVPGSGIRNVAMDDSFDDGVLSQIKYKP
jgi:hypothetical protein